MPLAIPNRTAAECPRTYCRISGRFNKKKYLSRVSVQFGTFRQPCPTSCEAATGRPASLLKTVENIPVTMNVIERLHSDKLSLRLHSQLYIFQRQIPEQRRHTKLTTLSFSKSRHITKILHNSTQDLQSQTNQRIHRRISTG